ncbi:MAG TPA: hypothetical protein VLV54_21520 [Thermoanaerobaculia bacterium]|nr:hypothetical protein [Thermoanaerobaculia bacterium]
MDPTIAFELAKALFAGISAAAAAVQVWYKSRDSKEAAATFDAVHDKVLASPETAAAAEQLVAIIPEEVIEDLETRADNCWTGYRRVLGGDFLPDEIDHATDAVQGCVCRELGRISKLNGSIPSRWKGQWERYSCATRGQAKVAMARA